MDHATMASRDTKRLLAALQNAERSVARERRHRLAAAGLNLAQAQILDGEDRYPGGRQAGFLRVAGGRRADKR